MGVPCPPDRPSTRPVVADEQETSCVRTHRTAIVTASAGAWHARAGIRDDTRAGAGTRGSTGTRTFTCGCGIARRLCSRWEGRPAAPDTGETGVSGETGENRRQNWRKLERKWSRGDADRLEKRRDAWSVDGGSPLHTRSTFNSPVFADEQETSCVRTHRTAKCDRVRRRLAGKLVSVHSLVIELMLLLVLVTVLVRRIVGVTSLGRLRPPAHRFFLPVVLVWHTGFRRSSACTDIYRYGETDGLSDPSAPQDHQSGKSLLARVSAGSFAGKLASDKSHQQDCVQFCIQTSSEKPAADADHVVNSNPVAGIQKSWRSLQDIIR